MPKNPNSHVGQHEDFSVYRGVGGYYWEDTRSEGSGETQGPFDTSAQAYQAFHSYIGWKELD